MLTHAQAERFRARLGAGGRPPVPGPLRYMLTLALTPGAVAAVVARERAFDHGTRARDDAARLTRMGLMGPGYALTPPGRAYAAAQAEVGAVA